MNDLFISYASQDRAFARMLREKLKKEGMTVWMDESGIGIGEDWTSKIAKALKDSLAFVLIFSSNSIGSDNVKDELSLAARNRIAIIPIRIEDIEPSDFFEMRLSRYNWVNIFETQQEKIDEVVDGIKERIDRMREGKEKEPPPQKSNEGLMEKKYKSKLREFLSDDKIVDSERHKLEAFAEAFGILPERANQLEEEVKKERVPPLDNKEERESVDQREISQQKLSQEEKDDDGETVKKKEKRITYSNWSEFESEQGQKDAQKKTNLPIAKKIHDLVVDILGKRNINFEMRYGDGTFSLSIPKGEAKSAKRTFVKVGLLSIRDKSVYVGLYKKSDDNLPTGGLLWRKNDANEYVFRMKTIEDFEKVKDSIKGGIINSYNYLAITDITEANSNIDVLDKKTDIEAKDDKGLAAVIQDAGKVKTETTEIMIKKGANKEEVPFQDQSKVTEIEDRIKEAEDSHELVLIAEEIIKELDDRTWAKKIVEEAIDRAIISAELRRAAVVIGSDEYLGDKDWARKVFIDAIKQANDRVSLCSIASDILEYLGDKALAIEAYKAAVDISEGAYDLAYAARDIANSEGLNDKDWAKVVFITAIEKSENAGDSACCARWIASDDILGDKNWARKIIKDAESSCETCKDFSSIAIALADKDALNDKKLAKTYYEGAVERSDKPDDLKSTALEIACYMNDKKWARRVLKSAIDKVEDADAVYQLFSDSKVEAENLSGDEDTQWVDDALKDAVGASDDINYLRKLAEAITEYDKDLARWIYEQAADKAAASKDLSRLADSIADTEYLGDKKWARKIFVDAIKKTEGSLDMAYAAYLIAFQHTLDDKKWAIDLFKRAIEGEEDSIYLANIASFIANDYSLCDKQWARNLFDKAIRKADTAWEQAVVGKMLAIEIGMNDKKNALRLFEKAIEIAGDDDDLMEIAEGLADDDGLADKSWAGLIRDRIYVNKRGEYTYSNVYPDGSSEKDIWRDGKWIEPYKESIRRKELASSSETSKEDLDTLLQDHYRWVRKAAASNEKIDDSTIKRLLESKDRYVLEGLAANPKCSGKDRKNILELLKDEKKYPRQFDTYRLVCGDYGAIEKIIEEVDEDDVIHLITENGDIDEYFNEKKGDWDSYTGASVNWIVYPDGSAEELESVNTEGSEEDDENNFIARMGDGDIIIKGQVEWCEGHNRSFSAELEYEFNVECLKEKTEFGVPRDYSYEGDEKVDFNDDGNWELSDGSPSASLYIVKGGKRQELAIEEIRSAIKEKGLDPDDEDDVKKYLDDMRGQILSEIPKKLLQKENIMKDKADIAESSNLRQMEKEAEDMSDFINLAKKIMETTQDHNWALEMLRKAEEKAEDSMNFAYLADNIMKIVKDKSWAITMLKKAEEKAESQPDFYNLFVRIMDITQDKNWVMETLKRAEERAQDTRSLAYLAGTIMDFTQDKNLAIEKLKKAEERAQNGSELEYLSDQIKKIIKDKGWAKKVMKKSYEI